MMSSVDGRQLVDRWTKPAAGVSSSILRDHYDRLYQRMETDGWIVGRKTMAYYATSGAPRTSTEGPSHRENWIADRSGRQLAIGIDLTGKLQYHADHLDGDHIVTILGRAVTDEYLHALRDLGVSYVFADDGEGGILPALEAIRSGFGVDRLCLQGGGSTNGAFLKAGLIDEISIIIYPGIDGMAGSPSIFGYEGDRPNAGQSLRHVSTETLEGGAVWIRYRVEPEPADSVG